MNLSKQSAGNHRLRELTLEIPRTSYEVFTQAANEISRRTGKPVTVEAVISFLLEAESDPLDIAALYCWHLKTETKS